MKCPVSPLLFAREIKKERQKMCRTTVILIGALCIGMFATPPSGFCKASAADLHESYRRVAPEMEEQAALFFANQAKYVAVVRKNMELTHVLPPEPDKADAYMRTYVAVYAQFYGVIFRGQPLGDKTLLTNVLNDDRGGPSERQLAAQLLYMDSGDIDVMVKGLLLVPVRAGIFCRVQDPQFGDILRRLLAKSAEEEADLRLGGRQGEPRPYSQCLNNAFRPLVKAVFFQKADLKLAQALLAKTEYLKGGGKYFDPFHIADVAKDVREASLGQFAWMVNLFLQQGRFEDVQAIRIACPDADSRRTVDGCVIECVTALTKQIRLLREVPRGGDVPTTQPH